MKFLTNFVWVAAIALLQFNITIANAQESTVINETIGFWSVDIIDTEQTTIVNTVSKYSLNVSQDGQLVIDLKHNDGVVDATLELLADDDSQVAIADVNSVLETNLLTGDYTLVITAELTASTEQIVAESFFNIAISSSDLNPNDLTVSKIDNGFFVFETGEWNDANPSDEYIFYQKDLFSFRSMGFWLESSSPSTLEVVDEDFMQQYSELDYLQLSTKSVSGVARFGQQKISLIGFPDSLDQPSNFTFNIQDYSTVQDSDGWELYERPSLLKNLEGVWENSGSQISEPVYRLTVPKSGQVTISLESENDSYLYLRNSNYALIEDDDDSGLYADARIVRTLSQGTYFIVAGQYDGGFSGSFNLNIRSNDFDNNEVTIEEADVISLQSGWTTRYGSSGPTTSDTGNPRFQLDITETTELNIALDSSIDNFLYLLNEDSGFISSANSFGQNGVSTITNTLSPGRYFLVAGTSDTRRTADFEISVRSLGSTSGTFELARKVNAGDLTFEATVTFNDDEIRQYQVGATTRLRISLSNNAEPYCDDFADELDSGFTFYATPDDFEEQETITVRDGCSYSLQLDVDSDTNEDGNGSSTATQNGSVVVRIDDDGTVTVTLASGVDLDRGADPTIVTIGAGISTDIGEVDFNVLQQVMGNVSEIADRNSVKLFFENADKNRYPSLTNTINAVTKPISGIDKIYFEFDLPLVRTAYNFVITYTIDGNEYQISDNFTFRSDGINTRYNIPQTILVNRIPVATSETITTKQNTAVNITLAGTDSDGDTLTYAVTSQPANGELTNNNNGTWTFTPTAGFTGSTSFNFTATDSYEVSEVGTINITIAANNAPVATAQTITTDEDTPKTFTLMGTDVDSDSLTYTIVTNPQNGTLTQENGEYTFTPSANFNGSSSFTFFANDGVVNSAAATVAIVVSAVNDAPTIQGTPATTLTDGQQYLFIPTANDIDSENLTFTITNKPSWAAFDNTTGMLSGEPERTDAGTTVGIVIGVEDSEFFANLAAFNLEVTLSPDTDEDGISDSKDLDDDNDNVPDTEDAFPLDPTESVDTDLDGIGNNADTDDDGDGIEDVNDGFPLIKIGNLTDTDGDGIPNECDLACIALGMTADTDDDNDGITDEEDGFPLIAIGNLTDTDGDGIPNDCDQACVTLGMTADDDDDNDGIADVNDGFSLVAIGNLTDTDGDGIPNDCDQTCIDAGMTADTDDDGDGVADEIDAFPLDVTEAFDTDLDGIGNNEDTDDDGDLLPDSFENENGLDPLDKSDALLDKDQDNLSNIEEYNLGTDINNVDTDGDGITDDIDARPLDFDNAFPGAYRGDLYLLPDMTDDEVQEVGVLSVNAELAQIELEVIDGKRKIPLKTIVWADAYADTTLSLHLIGDMNDNGSIEVGLFGIQNTAINASKPQMFIRDLDTNNRVSVLNWPANWTEVSALIVPDMTGDGIPEAAIQGRFNQGSRPQLVIRNGLSGGAVRTYSYPNLFNDPIYNVHSDVDGDGFAEISTFGRISRNNKIQVKIADGLNPSNRLKAYNFPDKWQNVSWHQLSDSNRDGKADWGLFGISKEDGRPQLINKDGADPKGALRIYGWSDDLQNAQFFRIPDMNNDGIDEVAAAGRRSNGRYQFMIKDGADRNSVLANHNLNLPLESLSFHVLPDLNGDEKAEIGFLGINALGQYELVIREGDVANGEWLTHNLGSDWSEGLSIESLGDTDGDGAANLVIYGQNAVADKLVIYGL